jgi:hypothetical protein
MVRCSERSLLKRERPTSVSKGVQHFRESMALTHIGVLAMCALLRLAMQSAGCHGLCQLSAVHMHTRSCLGVMYGRAARVPGCYVPFLLQEQGSGICAR